MEAATQAFLVTVAIVGGILSPFIFIAIIKTITAFLNALTAQILKFTEDMKRRPPFSDVEVNVNPATNVMTVRMLKDGDIIWQGSSSRREMEENDRLVFTTETPE